MRMDALHLFGLRCDAVHAGFVDDLLDALSDEQIRARPHGLNSIAWLLSHGARVEDVAVNRFVANDRRCSWPGTETGGWGSIGSTSARGCPRPRSMS